MLRTVGGGGPAVGPQVLEGLKYAARNPTITVPTQRYIEAARHTRDSSTMMAVASFLERQGKIDSS